MKKQNTVIFKNNKKIKSRQWWDKTIVKVNKNCSKIIQHKRIKDLLKTTEISLVFTNDNELKVLNKKYRKINKSTDVLSFHITPIQQKKQRYLGDIIISLDYAKKNAMENKHSLIDECILLVVHGYLHLIGYDHKTSKEEKIMFKLQNKIIKNLIKTV